MLRDLSADVRYTLRQWRRRPGFALIAVMALALGVGANTAIFSAVDALLIRALPYPDADRLVMVWEDASYVGFPRNTPAPANYVDWRQQNKVFADMAAMRSTAVNLTGDGTAEMLPGTEATANLFQVLGVQPLKGRIWTAREEETEANVAVLGYGVWRRRFGADPNIIGQTVQMNGRATQVLGVMPAGFAFPDREREVYLPSGLNAAAWARRQSHFLRVVARLKPGVSYAQAQQEMNVIAQRLQRTYPESNTNIGAVVVPIREDLLGDTRPQLYILVAAAACVLLIACANVANLLLARSTARRREMAVRTALGAGARRLLRQNLTESLLLSLAGTSLGLLLAVAGLQGLNHFIPENFVGVNQLSLNGMVLALTMAVALLTALLFGLAPALGSIRLPLYDTLKQGDKGAAGLRRNALRSGLVVAEVALSLLLLVTAGLLLQTLMKLRQLDTGFRTDHLLTVRTSFAQPRYREDGKELAFLEQAVRQLQTIPGVERAAFTSTLPFHSIGNTNSFVIEGRPPLLPGASQDSLMRVGTTDYLRLLGVKLLAGRLFDERDRADSPKVVVINDVFARAFWPNTSPIGQRIRYGAANVAPWFTVIGVIADVRERGFQQPMKYGSYTLQSQYPGWSPSSLALRTTGDPLSVVPALRQKMRELDPELPLTRVRTMEEMMDLELAQRDRQMALLAAFAALALVLASIGLYGVLSYVVAQRTREIGIRMALGAQASNVVRDVLRHGATLALLGIVCGAAGALALARAFQSLLFGVTPADPATYLGVAALLMMVTLAACFVPARRAAAVDPARVLREE